MSLSVTSKIWGIFESPGRKIRTCVKVNNEVAFVQVKLFRTGITTESLSLTLAEFQLLPIADLLDSTTYSHHEIYNGRRRVGITYTNENMIVFTLLKLKDDDEWDMISEIEMTENELELFNTFIPEILDLASSQVFKTIVGTD